MRRDANEAIKKLVKDGMSQDDEKRATADVQKMTDEHIAKIDELLKAKEKEIMSV